MKSTTMTDCRATGLQKHVTCMFWVFFFFPNSFPIGVDELEVWEYSLRLPKYFRSNCEFPLTFSSKIMLRIKKRILQMVQRVSLHVLWKKQATITLPAHARCGPEGEPGWQQPGARGGRYKAAASSTFAQSSPIFERHIST